MVPENSPVVSSHNPLLFVHVPKTGGISLFASFAAVWGENIADLYNVSAGDAPGIRRATEGGSYAVYSGHFSYGFHEWVAGECMYATVLREPVSRIESLYFFLRRRWADYQRRFLEEVAGVTPRPLPIPDFHRDFGQWLTADREEAEKFFQAPSLELDNGMVRRFSGHGQNPEACTERTLLQAMENLEAHFSVVGLTERYSETIQLMSRVLRLPDFAEQRVNVTSGKPPPDQQLSAELRERIRNLNQFDIKLHEWARERFDRHVSSARPITITGLARTDFEKAPLWKSVGSPGVRTAIKRHRGVMAKVQEERKPRPPAKLGVSHRLSKLGFSRHEVLLEFEGSAHGQTQVSSSPVKVVLTAHQAESLVTELQKLLAAQKDRFGKPQDMQEPSP